MKPNERTLIGILYFSIEEAEIIYDMLTKEKIKRIAVLPSGRDTENYAEKVQKIKDEQSLIMEGLRERAKDFEAASHETK